MQHGSYVENDRLKQIRKSFNKSQEEVIDKLNEDASKNDDIVDNYLIEKRILDKSMRTLFNDLSTDLSKLISELYDSLNIISIKQGANNEGMLGILESVMGIATGILFKRDNRKSTGVLFVLIFFVYKFMTNMF
jgi:hypothetical protein